MVNDDRKWEKRITMHLSNTFYLKKPDTQQEQIDSNSELKNPKSVPRFKPGVPRMPSLYHSYHHHFQDNMVRLR